MFWGCCTVWDVTTYRWGMVGMGSLQQCSWFWCHYIVTSLNTLTKKYIKGYFFPLVLLLPQLCDGVKQWLCCNVSSLLTLIQLKESVNRLVPLNICLVLLLHQQERFKGSSEWAITAKWYLMIQNQADSSFMKVLKYLMIVKYLYGSVEALQSNGVRWKKKNPKEMCNWLVHSQDCTCVCQQLFWYWEIFLTKV